MRERVDGGFRCGDRGRRPCSENARPIASALSAAGAFSSPLCRGRDWGEIFAGKHVGEQGEQLRLNLAVRRENLFARDAVVFAGKIRYTAAGLFNQQDACRSIPRVEIELPKGLHPAGGDIGQIERGRAGAAHAVRAQGKFLVKVNVWAGVALTAREAR